MMECLILGCSVGCVYLSYRIYPEFWTNHVAHFLKFRDD